MSEDYFSLAVRLARTEGQATLQRVAAKASVMRAIANKPKPAPCACSAYKWPHRPGSGKCPAPEADPRRYGVQKLSAWDAEELALFDRAEARAINNGFN